MVGFLFWFPVLVSVSSCLFWCLVGFLFPTNISGSQFPPGLVWKFMGRGLHRVAVKHGHPQDIVDLGCHCLAAHASKRGQTHKMGNFQDTPTKSNDPPKPCRLHQGPKLCPYATLSVSCISPQMDIPIDDGTIPFLSVVVIKPKRGSCAIFFHRVPSRMHLDSLRPLENRGIPQRS